MSQEQHSPSRGVTAEVQDFYERYPYPRPIESLEKYQRLGQDRQGRRVDYHLCWPARSYKEDLSILIAGCGTSQAAKHALRWPAAQVTGIDFSATSVRCTEELKRKYNLNNLQVYQLPIDRVNDLKMSFDQIICTGVLHHLADPDAGLSALGKVLKPGGAMHLMVYAPYGRAGIYMLQEFCKRIGIRPNDEAIRDLIAALTAIPPGHPLENLLNESPDFRQEAALADALLNPQDRSYSVPQLFDFIGNAGLTFGRWIKQAPYTPQCGVLARIPQASRLKELSIAEQYAAVELFRGTMIRHSVVVYRNDNPDPQQVTLAGDAWLRYVPLRMPDTICVQDRLSHGAAGVLINKTHAYRDLIMPIDSTEKRLFDAIDGRCSIADMVERTWPASQTKSQLNVARNFFENLWWYDQVVFDASRCKAQPSSGESGK
ncbi:MAG TPA: class I SAM-dependent methyltransferase [Candidatus Binatia bacterium]|nr:class I SAM-dependent methyltransferase [Candidatus Binatia bacterium]